MPTRMSVLLKSHFFAPREDPAALAGGVGSPACCRQSCRHWFPAGPQAGGSPHPASNTGRRQKHWVAAGRAVPRGTGIPAGVPIFSQLLRERITNSSASPEARRSIRLSMFFIAFGGRSGHANRVHCSMARFLRRVDSAVCHRILRCSVIALPCCSSPNLLLCLMRNFHQSSLKVSALRACLAVPGQNMKQSKFCEPIQNLRRQKSVAEMP